MIWRRAKRPINDESAAPGDGGGSVRLEEQQEPHPLQQLALQFIPVGNVRSLTERDVEDQQ